MRPVDKHNNDAATFWACGEFQWDDCRAFVAALEPALQQIRGSSLRPSGSSVWLLVGDGEAWFHRLVCASRRLLLWEFEDELSPVVRCRIFFLLRRIGCGDQYLIQKTRNVFLTQGAHRF